MAHGSAIGYSRTQVSLKKYPDFWAAFKALRLDGETDKVTLVRLIVERVEQRSSTETPIPEALETLRSQVTADIRRLSRPMGKQREFEQGMLSTDAEMHWETFLRLKQKDFEANREEVRISSEQITCLEVEEYLPRRTGEDEGDAP
jgi:hypothetical protein